MSERVPEAPEVLVEVPDILLELLEPEARSSIRFTLVPSNETPAINPALVMTNPTMGSRRVFKSTAPVALRLATATVASAPTVHPLLLRKWSSASWVRNTKIIALDWAPA